MLSVKRPTVTTVRYSYSTRSPNPTIYARAFSYSLALLRILAAIFISLLLLHEYHTAFPSSTTVSNLDGALLSSPPGQLITLLTGQSTRLWRLLISAGVAWLIFRKGYTEESLLVIRGLGVQTGTSSPSYLWSGSTRFIPTSSIQDIFIHEAFKGFEVRFYLSIVVEGEEEAVVVFPRTLPQRKVLESVWRGTRACLYEPKG